VKHSSATAFGTLSQFTDPGFLESAQDILTYVRGCHDKAIPCAICVVTGVSGGSARSVGALVAVRADGEMAGYVSHGCVDADLSIQAQQAIQTGKPCEVIYGVGSPFMDLRLPCGGTVEILIDPAPDPELCKAALGRLRHRQAMSLIFDPEDGLSDTSSHSTMTGWKGQTFVSTYTPALRLIVAGIGAPLAAVVKMASTMDLPLCVYSPDNDAEAYFDPSDRTSFEHLNSPQDQLDLQLDKWSAVLLLFHDHDWEPSFLRAALSSDAFYIGALGSTRTHERRIEVLGNREFEQSQLMRIKGPIGIIPAARDAKTLALSVLVEIIDAYRNIPNT
jgi:xanthine dehydrogenase accessory factor